MECNPQFHNATETVETESVKLVESESFYKIRSSVVVSVAASKLVSHGCKLTNGICIHYMLAAYFMLTMCTSVYMADVASYGIV